jgi:N-acetylglucosaminyldiphosphoundecaprenol N-acetyl-beta-D-mannosaminyltransferase
MTGQDARDLLTAAGIAVVDGYGFRVHAGTLAQHLRLIELAIAERRKITVYDLNLHSLYFYLQDPAFAAAYHDAVVKIDSIPIVMMMKLLGRPVERDHRVTGADFAWPLFEQVGAHGWRVFCLGNYQPTVDAALPIARARVPGIAIDGHHGFFDQTPGCPGSLAMIEQINRFGADVLTVGLSSPYEQRWVAAHRHLIDAPVVATWGACMEYVAGTVSTPPRWMGRWGLEWAYRLAENPRRFGHRYLVEPWLLLALLLRHNLLPGAAGPRARDRA